MYNLILLLEEQSKRGGKFGLKEQEIRYKRVLL